jgi:tetratricopeptide (TPR) repeat protein
VSANCDKTSARSRRHRPATAVRQAALLMVLLAAPAAPAAERKAPAEPTIGDLKERPVEVRPQQKVEGSASRAIDNYRRYLESPNGDPEQQVEALRRLGDLNLEAGEGERMDREAASVDAAAAEAIKLYTSLLRQHPDSARNAEVLYQLARAYETTGQVDQALATLDRLTREFPDHAAPDEVAFRRGEILFSAKRYAEAEKAYAAAIDVGQKGGFYSQALYKHGWSVFKQGRDEDSLPSFVRVLDANLLDPADSSRMKPLEGLSRADRELVDDTLRVVSITFSNLDGARTLDPFIAQRGTPAYSYLLYSRLGDLYVEKQRYQDAADTYRAFVARDPSDENAPLLAMQAIEAYRRGGFGELVLAGKQEYVERYDFDGPFWSGRERASYPQVVAELRTNFKDVSTWYHATAQKSKKVDDFQVASRWYRDYLNSFPEDAEAAQTNYLLAETLLEARSYAEAAAEFDRTAYDYPRNSRSAAAGYAALVAYDRERAALQGEARTAWNLRTIDADIRFAKTFPEHPDSGGVITRAAQDVFALNDPARSIEVAELVLAHRPAVDVARQRIAWTIIGQSNFDLGAFEKAEAAYASARELTPASDPLREDLSKRLAASVYKQAEGRREAGDAAGAVDAFLRVASLSPDPVVRATAEYDAAAQLVNLKQWERAAGVLEGYRRKYPNDARAGDITRSLAVAYSESGRAGEAAVEFERIAATPGEDAAVRREALLTAAELYEKAGNLPKAAATLERFVADNPVPVARAIDARQKLADFAAARGDRARVEYWQREIVRADASAGDGRTERTRLLAARASLALAAPAREEFRAVKLVAPLKRSLEAKRKALDAAMKGYRAAADYKIAEVTTAATFEMAELYRRLGQDILKSERPKRLSAEEREQYDLLLEEQAFPFEEQAIEIHEANAARAREGIFDDGVRRSFAELAVLKPARYAKTELSADRLAGADPSTMAANAALALRAGDAGAAEVGLAAAATQPDAGAAIWTELGVTRRRLGRMEDAMAAYSRALSIDGTYNAANRNMAVLLDLYMDDPVAALPYMERYAPAPGEEKLLSGWIADLKQRAGKRAPAGPSPAEPAVADAAPAAPGVVPSGPAEKQEPTP